MLYAAALTSACQASESRLQHLQRIACMSSDGYKLLPSAAAAHLSLATWSLSAGIRSDIKKAGRLHTWITTVLD